MKKNCDNCGFFEKGFCLLDRSQKRGPLDTVCENYHNSVPRCDMCGLLTMQGILTETEEGWLLICENCYSSFGTCVTCTQACGVQNDTSGISKSILQQMQQGNMIIQTTVMNPELVNKYCPSCRCYIDNQCHRQYQNCKNYNSRVS